jgi:dTDP-4-dehydrorhamnose reductase
LDIYSHILFEIIRQHKIQGLYYIGGLERISRFDLDLKICNIFNFNKKLIKPVSVDNINSTEKRPKDYSLNNNKAISILKTKFMSIDEGLNALRRLNISKL